MAFLGGTGNLDDILDVNVAGAVQGQFLVYGGSNWSQTGIPSNNSLADRVFRLEQRQLQLPNLLDISNLSQNLTSQFNTLRENDAQQDDKIEQLIQGFVAVKGAINDLETAFVSHTGSTGAHGLK